MRNLSWVTEEMQVTIFIKNFKKVEKIVITANFEILNFKKRLLRIFYKKQTLIVFLK